MVSGIEQGDLMPEQLHAETLEDAEKALQLLATEWALRKKLAVYSSQVRVSIRIFEGAETDQITPEEWDSIINREWEPEELLLLQQIRANENKPLPRPHHSVVNTYRLATQLSRVCRPFFLSGAHNFSDGGTLQLKKRLLPSKRRRADPKT